MNPGSSTHTTANITPTKPAAFVGEAPPEPSPTPRERHTDQGGQMQPLLTASELLGKCRVEHSHELKAEQRLNSRQHHPAFFQEMGRGLLERQRLYTTGFIPFGSLRVDGRSP